MKQRIAVIGGGISGMTAAWYLQHWAPELDVHLFDASQRLGGVIESLRCEQGLIELGADNFGTLVPDALKFCQDMGVADQFISPNADNRLARIVARGAIYPVPTGFSLVQPTRIDSILSTPILSWRGRLRVLAEYWVKRRTEPSDESLEAFAVRRLGREAYDRLVEPIVGGIFTADGSKLSMQAALPQFVAMEQKYGGLWRAHFAKSKSQSKSDISARRASGARYDQFLAPKSGMQWWLDQIESQLVSGNVHLHKQSSVASLKRYRENQWEVATKGQTFEPFDGLIMALNAGPAANLLKAINPDLAEPLQQVGYASSVITAMVYPRNAIPAKYFCFGVIVPRIEQRHALAISFTSEKYPGRVSDDQVLLRVFMGGALAASICDRSDAELSDIATSELQDLLGITAAPQWRKVVRWPNSMPQYTVGHCDRMARLREQLQKYPSLQLAGNAYEGVGVPQCVRSGRQAADRLLESIGLRRRGL